MKLSILLGVLLAAALALGCSQHPQENHMSRTEPSADDVDDAPAPQPDPASDEEQSPQVVMETSKGDIVLELWPHHAPQTVENFLQYVDDGFYDGTIFHRVIADFMIQGGGFTEEMREKPTRSPVSNEASTAAPNKRGTVAMARTQDPHSAAAQFFVNLTDNDFLNHRAPTVQGYGYCVFGQVVEGMETVDAISLVRTGRSGHYDDVPVEPVVIRRARRVEGE